MNLSYDSQAISQSEAYYRERPITVTDKQIAHDGAYLSARIMTFLPELLQE